MPNTNWMAEFTASDRLTLSNITFPASHDAGLSHADDCYIPITTSGAKFSTGLRNFITPLKKHKSAKRDTVCQDVDVGGQLEAGSRAFDIRVAMAEGEPRTVHAEGGLAGKLGGGYGQRVTTALEQIDAFLEQFPTEIVIVRISHTDEETGATVARLVKQLIHRTRRFCSGPRNLAAIPLHDLRGKAVVIFSAEALPDPQPQDGLHRFAKYCEEEGYLRSGLHFCGKYAGFFAGINDVALDTIEAGDQHRSHLLPHIPGHAHMFMVYWQEAFDVEHKTKLGREERRGLKPHLPLQTSETTRRQIDYDRGTHYNLDFLLHLHRGLSVGPVQGQKSKISSRTVLSYQPNWINLDFINDAVCDKVIAFNRDMLELREQEKLRLKKMSPYGDD